MNKTNQNNQQKPIKERKLHDLIGTIQQKDLRKVYSHQKTCSPPNCSPDCHQGSHFWQLQVSLENHYLDKIFVFKEYLQKEQIWKDIKESNYIDRRYLFQCSKSRRTGQFALVNWRELPNHGRPKRGGQFNQPQANSPQGNFKDCGHENETK